MQQEADEKERNPDGLKFKVITPIFSYGVDNKSENSVPEIRPTSVKGMMRYMFRIAQPTRNTSDLRDLENTLFGGGKEEKTASPIRLAVTKKIIPIDEENPNDPWKHKFLFHDKAKRWDKGKNKLVDDNPKRKYIPPESEFTLRLSLRNDLKQLEKLQKKLEDERILNEAEKKRLENLEEKYRAGYLKELKWYKDLLELSLLLIGLGQRSRKGRGRCSCKVYQSEIDCKKDILSMLDTITERKNYKLNEDESCIEFDGKSDEKRPFIKEIVFGEAKEKTWRDFFECLDWASHDIKDARNEGKAAIVSNGNFHATGQAKPRFASSIIVGCAQIDKKILPIYTYIRPVVKEYVLDADNELKEFIKAFEEGENRWLSVPKMATYEQLKELQEAINHGR